MSINFAHPADPERSHLYADLYYQYYDLIKLRSMLRHEFANAHEASATPCPRLPEEVQAALEEIETEARQLSRPSRPIEDVDIPQDLLDRREYIFSNTMKLGARAWHGSGGEVSSVDGLRASMRYCEYCLDQLREKIEFLHDNVTTRDPFVLLQGKVQPEC
ncbi:MAG: hypothetical protein IPG61_09685 [bacterium]|nr:hypothetical protein [bacterium]